MLHAPLPQRTVRAIDRLARSAHAFHRFAHHPLCERYAGELIPLGRRARLCRGCAASALGSVMGLLAALAWQPSFSVLLGASALGLGLLLSSLARRLPKWRGRTAATACLGFAESEQKIGPASTLAPVRDARIVHALVDDIEHGPERVLRTRQGARDREGHHCPLSAAASSQR